MTGRGYDTLQYPPMALNLHYLITCHSPSDPTTRSVDEHRVMGKVMQLFYDNALLRGTQLQGTLGDNNEELRLIPQPVTMETLISMFSDTPYKLSLSYMVGPVYLDSTRTKPAKRVVEAQFTLEEQRGS